MIKNIFNEDVLILNKNWLRIRVRDLKNAILLITRDRANIIDHDDKFLTVYTWDKWIKLPVKEDQQFILTTRGRIRLPEIIVLTHYGKIPNASPRLSKKNIFIRDDYKCQYSGKKVSPRNADIDHIKPKSRDGKTNWNNLVVCSKEINRIKGDRTPEEAGLTLLNKPEKPGYSRLIIDPKRGIKESWKQFLGDEYK